MHRLIRHAAFAALAMPADKAGWMQAAHRAMYMFCLKVSY